MIQPWPTVRSEPLSGYRIFHVRRDHKVSPRTGREHDFFVLEAPDWVNVIALTTQQEMVLVEQYRHGTNTVELEIPGGVMDRLDTSPVDAAVRELREETGYAGDRAWVLGRVLPNPAFMSNSCYTVVVENCRLQHALELDHAEDVATRLAPAAEVLGLVLGGKIRHSLVVAAIYQYDLWTRGLLQPAPAG